MAPPFRKEKHQPYFWTMRMLHNITTEDLAHLIATTKSLLANGVAVWKTPS